MLGTFSSIAANSPLQRKRLDPSTESYTSYLHYRVTFVFLVGASLLVTCLDVVGNGNTITCVREGNQINFWNIPQNVINTYCYVLTTFTLPKHFASAVGQEAAEVGVGAFHPQKDVVSFKAYYQWVPFVLFLQGLMFYLPHALFKLWEGGKVISVLGGLNIVVLDNNTRLDMERSLADYIADSLNTHNIWALKLLLTEMFNLAVVLGNMYFVDVFLGGEFSTYGLKVVDFLEADSEQRFDPMATIFPRVTKCSFYKYGPSGTVQTHDALCILPINIINEKVYVFLWFWLMILASLTAIGLIYHVVMLFTPGLNRIVLRIRSKDKDDTYFEEMSEKFQYGDWKLMYLLGINMDPVTLGEFLREVYKSLRNKTDKTEIKLILDNPLKS